MAATAKLIVTTDDQNSARKLRDINEQIGGMGRKSAAGFGGATTSAGGLGRAVGMLGGRFASLATKVNPAVAVAVYGILAIRNAVNKFAENSDRFLQPFEDLDEAAMNLGARLGWSEGQAENFRNKMLEVAKILGKTAEEVAGLEEELADFAKPGEDIHDLALAFGEVEAVAGKRGAREWISAMQQAHEKRGVTMTAAEMRGAAEQITAFRGLEGRGFVRGRGRLRKQIARGVVGGAEGQGDDVARAFSMATGSEADLERRRQTDLLGMMIAPRRRAAARAIREFKDSDASIIPGSETAQRAWTAGTWRARSNSELVGKGSQLVPRALHQERSLNPDH